MVLEADTARFLGDKAGLIIGVVGLDGRPFATRGWGLTVLDRATGRSRLLIDAAERCLFDHLAGGGAIAVTGSDVPSLRSCQVKGHVEDFDEVTDADIEHSAHYCAGFFGDIEAADHFPLHLLERIRPDELAACHFVIEEVYDQTPGPNAGTPMIEDSP
ncbi:MAG TPA: hypothetical protein VIY72_15045 [Acidimicrobiales bacterium]